MKIIGLTGGIASGKSTVSEHLHTAHGVPILDADAAAYRLAEPHGPMWAAFVERYGRTRALFPDGRLNRAAIGEIVFRDAAERGWMDNMAHPLIRAELLKRLAGYREDGTKIVTLDVPLLYEVGWENLVDEVWVVYVDETVQLRRLMARNGLSEDLARERMGAQMPLSEKKRRADVVIDNDGTVMETRAQVDRALERLLVKE